MSDQLQAEVEALLEQMIEQGKAKRERERRLLDLLTKDKPTG